MTNKEIILEVLSLVEFNYERLVSFAEEGKGFMGDEGAYGLTYPENLDKYDKEVEGRSIPEGMIEVHYWDNGEQSILVPLKEYISTLREFLASKGDAKLSQRVDKIKI
jgi:hypothetical protein